MIEARAGERATRERAAKELENLAKVAEEADLDEDSLEVNEAIIRAKAALWDFELLYLNRAKFQGGGR